MDTNETPTRTEAEETPGHKPFGPVAAAFLAAGVGAVVLGILTTLAEASEDVADALQWNDRVGPLSGKTILAVVGYVVAWVVLATVYRGKDPDPRKIFTWTWILLAIALILTFPVFFQLFAPEGS
jgi:uncharacterized membrane protein YdcZ (DUF606 family)